MKSHPGAFHLLDEMIRVRHRTKPRTFLKPRPNKALEGGIVHILRRRPAKTRLSKPDAILAYGGTRNLAGLGYLAGRQTRLEPQPQYLSNFAHGQSFPRHSYLQDKYSKVGRRTVQHR